MSRKSRKFNESAYVNRGVDANLNEFWDEEGARECAEGMAEAHMERMLALTLARGTGSDLQVASYEALQGYHRLAEGSEGVEVTPIVSDSDASGARFGAIFPGALQIRVVWRMGAHG